MWIRTHTYTHTYIVNNRMELKCDGLTTNLWEACFTLLLGKIIETPCIMIYYTYQRR